MTPIEKLLSTDGFWYVGSPYSKYPDGIKQAFIDVCAATADLLRLGVPVFSPIAHSHPIAIHGTIDPLDHNIWLPFDGPMMDAAAGLIVLKMPSWADSYGLMHEIDHFHDQGKPVEYLEWPINLR